VQEQGYQEWGKAEYVVWKNLTKISAIAWSVVVVIFSKDNEEG